MSPVRSPDNETFEPMRLSGISALAASLVLTATMALAAPAARPQVTVDTGALSGVKAPGVSVFRGIPYAAPPVGPLRWKATQAPAAWKGVRDAAKFGPACPQDEAHKEAWAQVGPRSEDCLTLNVWHPEGAKKAAVMVFLHGGGFTYGGAGVPLYDGANLAKRGVVVVTLNYRLGILGFFAHPALTAEDPNGKLGNYGIMDQVEALRWVQRNIARFGGDPANVTVFGESAGAGTVQVMMGSPDAKGLFAKAISESGSGGTTLPLIRGGPGTGEVAGERFAKSVGLDKATPEQLRALPLDKLLVRASPMLDGKVVRYSPGVPFNAKTEFKVPMMIGSNSNESTLGSNTDSISRLALGSAYAGILEEYRKRPSFPADAAVRDLAEDTASVQESLFIADLHAANGATTYAYYFDQVPVADRAKSFGAEHGGEMEYLFGNKPVEHDWDDADRRVAKLMGDYWTRFAKTGNPNGGGAPVWKPVKGKPTDYLSFGVTTVSKPSTDLEERVRAATLATVQKLWAPQPKP
jgi:para-nitrobenzyl esterase